MRKSIFIFLSLFFVGIFSCDDGDIITVELDFGETFDACGETDLVFYKTKEDPSESLSVLIPNYSIAEILEVGDDNTFTDTKSATFYYRTYSDISLPSNLFCSSIPPKTDITLDEESACTALITTVLTEDDNDGVPFALEFDGDTDGDGLPDYIDLDDDGDNILTANENPDPNGDGDLSDAQDTDGDGKPDYLDDDDDEDGVLTRDEENQSQDRNPANDITNSDIGADYLNPAVATTVPAAAFREHTILQTYAVTLKLTGISLPFLSLETLDFGSLENVQGEESLTNSRKITPAFN
jgi:hypothetical protein